MNGTEQPVGCASYVRIDGVTWKWLSEVKAGEPYVKAIMGYTTATRSILNMEAGPVRFNMSFLSPIEVCYFWVLGVAVHNSSLSPRIGFVNPSLSRIYHQALGDGWEA